MDLNDQRRGPEAREAAGPAEARFARQAKPDGDGGASPSGDRLGTRLLNGLLEDHEIAAMELRP
jgi:hypothetical protein